MKGVVRGLSRTRLRFGLGAFFFALAVPAAVLVLHAYDQLKWEAFHQARGLAEELSGRIDQRIATLIASEERRGFADYQFLIVRGDASANVLGLSPLSAFPVRDDFPGLIGYFQVDPQGRFSSPLLPEDERSIGDYITPSERAQRAEARAQILRVLAENQLVTARPSRTVLGAAKRELAAELDDRAASSLSSAADAVARQDASLRGEAELAEQAATPSASEPIGRRFDELKTSRTRKQSKRKLDAPASPRVSDLKLNEPYPQDPAKDLEERAVSSAPVELQRRAPRKELSQIPAGDARIGRADEDGAARIRTFESELDPFELSLLDETHLVMYRKVWRDGQRWVQGALVDWKPFLDATVGSAFRSSTVSTFSNLVHAWQDQVSVVYEGRSSPRYLTRASSEAMSGALLYRTRLTDPMSDLELLFTVTRMPAGPGARVVALVAAALALVLIGGVIVMYHLGCREIDLARQQQDFVAAVSHELRTPLTSIRMYGEMLREGWTSEEKKRGYYDFIVQESERLSRLIANVLQLARMTRNDATLELRDLSVGELLDGVRSKVASQIEQAGFELAVTAPDSLNAVHLQVDPDGFSQIFINLVDNALKFSRDAEVKRIELKVESDATGRKLRFVVRDHGPGIARDQMKKIFRLFYRSENELTRETVGTGIGLALVHQLAASMHASVEVRNADPGAAFELEFARP